MAHVLPPAPAEESGRVAVRDPSAAREVREHLARQQLVAAAQELRVAVARPRHQDQPAQPARQQLPQAAHRSGGPATAKRSTKSSGSAVAWAAPERPWRALSKALATASRDSRSA